MVGTGRRDVAVGRAVGGDPRDFDDLVVWSALDESTGFEAYESFARIFFECVSAGKH